MYQLTQYISVTFLQGLLTSTKSPIHLVTISSSSAWRMRKNESLYSAMRAAQAAFTRQLVPELLESHPGSRVTLIHPSGLAIPAFRDERVSDPKSLLDARAVSRIIWDAIERDAGSYLELQIHRRLLSDGTSAPELIIGSRAPEEPEQIGD